MAMPSPPILHECSSPETLAEQQALAVAGILRNALAERERALFAVSGGRSPIALFEHLSHQSLDWKRVTVLLVDERFVRADDPASNARLVREYLLRRNAAVADFLPPITDGRLSAAQSAEDYGDFINALHQPLDLVLLGMGEDGHIASIFPESPNLEALCDAESPQPYHVTMPPNVPQVRLTMGLRLLIEARDIMLSISGSAKRRIYERARAKASAERPISLLLAARQGPLTVWSSPA